MREYRARKRAQHIVAAERTDLHRPEETPMPDLATATRVRNTATDTLRIRRRDTDLWDAPDHPGAEPVTTADLEALAEMKAEDE